MGSEMCIRDSKNCCPQMAAEHVDLEFALSPMFARCRANMRHLARTVRHSNLTEFCFRPKFRIGRRRRALTTTPSQMCPCGQTALPCFAARIQRLALLPFKSLLCYHNIQKAQLETTHIAVQRTLLHNATKAVLKNTQMQAKG